VRNSGNFDIYVMPSSGGEAKRLTFHSSPDVPGSFMGDDKSVLFTSARQDSAANVQFPMSVFRELHGISVKGGEAALVLTQPAISAAVDLTCPRLVYHL